MKYDSELFFGQALRHNFIKYNQDQQHLLPKHLSDWVEEDSLERFVSDTTDYLDTNGRLEPFYPEPREDGRPRPSYHPVMLLKVLVFGYSIGHAVHSRLG